MNADTEPIECPELRGKSIQTLKIYRDQLDGTEIHIAFVDGTTFSCCISTRQSTEASLIVCGGPGEPEVLHKYDLD